LGVLEGCTELFWREFPVLSFLAWSSSFWEGRDASWKVREKKMFVWACGRQKFLGWAEEEKTRATKKLRGEDLFSGDLEKPTRKN